MRHGRSESRLFTDYLLPQTVYSQPTEDAWQYPNLIRPSPTSTVSTTLTSTSDESSCEVCKEKRIFVARIPSHVTEDALRAYFERFGTIEDAYIPKNIFTNTSRGIGFVTFEDPCVVDVVMVTRHSLGGADIIVDRAKPREAKDIQKEESGTFVNNDILMGSHGSIERGMFDPNCLGQFFTPGAYPNSHSNNRGPVSHISDEWETSFETGINEAAVEATSRALKGLTLRQVPEAAKKLQRSPGTMTERNQRMTENSVHVQKVRGGPRLYVRKLAKETVEQDVVDYFSQFGRVLDVYIPRSKGNKKQRRDFAFVTFDTEASSKRAMTHPKHCVNGAMLAIEVAVPEEC